ncbi:MAG TPA: flagellar hook-length control protein FliK [Candidatus Binatia bacterium]|jgi:hypothetical protein
MAGPVAAFQGAAFIPAETVGAGTLRPGQVLQGTVAGVPGELELRVAGLRASLDSSVGLSAGEIVSVTVESAENGLRLVVLPIAAPAETQPSTAGEVATTTLAQVLDLLDAAPGLRAAAAELLPANLPLAEPEMAALLRLLTTRGTVAEDLQQIASWVAQASDEGALAPELAVQLAALAHELVPAEADDLERAARDWGTSTSRPFEARLAEAIEARSFGEVSAMLGRDLRAVLQRLQTDETFRQWIARHGQLAAFESAIGRVLERTLAGSLQNLRQFEAPYLFFDLPLPPDAPVTRAQVHVFGEGGRGHHGFDKQNASITLDLSTQKLGDLWISLTITAGVCSCVVRATSDATFAAMTAASGELAQVLADTGYPNAAVQVTQWSGNRLEETAYLMRRFSGLDVRA